MAKTLTFTVTVIAEPVGHDIDPTEVGVALSDEIDGLDDVWAQDDEHDDEQSYTIHVQDVRLFQ